LDKLREGSKIKVIDRVAQNNAAIAAGAFPTARGPRHRPGGGGGGKGPGGPGPAADGGSPAAPPPSPAAPASAASPAAPASAN
ncbi:MAG TPA: hypothetical protein VNX00_06020, partial [Herbaspirillum sp.]|nr:hypothetical protein [Herbaspirillum sp.]